MKIKIVEDPFLISTLYLDDATHSFKNTLKLSYFTDSSADDGNQNFVEITRLIDHKSINKYKL